MVLRCEIEKRGSNLYVGECLELGVVTQGNTVDECKRNLNEAIEAWIEAAREASGEIVIRPAPFYGLKKIKFDLLYNIKLLSAKRGYFKTERYVPVGEQYA